jgi:hypothetical protein
MCEFLDEAAVEKFPDDIHFGVMCNADAVEDSRIGILALSHCYLGMNAEEERFCRCISVGDRIYACRLCSQMLEGELLLKGIAGSVQQSVVDIQ